MLQKLAWKTSLLSLSAVLFMGFQHSTHASACRGDSINFNQASLIDYADQNNDNKAIIVEDGCSLFMEGNTWVTTQETYTLTENTVLEFSYQSNAEGEIQGIGFDQDITELSGDRLFRIHGAQPDFAIPFGQTYPGDGSYKTYYIEVGKYFQGDGFHLVLAMDQDVPLGGNAYFDNIRLFEKKPATSTPPAEDKVTLTKGTYDFQHYAYTLNPDLSMQNVDYNNIVTTQYETWILENKYLKVTLVPSFGGRVLSMFNKITGHEELYQNPVGSPYLINAGIFYYDWLLIMGGIFPTFPEAEHGKSWLREWDFEIIEESDGEVTVAMSYQDNDEYAGHPANMPNGITNLICTYTITLKAGRTALDTVINLENPTNEAKQYEYWTDTTLSPGSDPNNPRATEGLEIIAPIDRTDYIYGIGPQDWENIKWYKNHTGEGIAYAGPNMQGANFWGAINHDNEEGIFRVADNNLTPGLKIWTFGHENTKNLDPFTNHDWHRPAIELWAGTGNQFFFRSGFPANSSYDIPEIYSPSVGLTNVTHASNDVLLNLDNNGAHFFFMTPDDNYRVEILQNGNQVYQETLTPDPSKGNLVPGNFGAGMEVRVSNEAGESVMSVRN